MRQCAQLLPVWTAAVAPAAAQRTRGQWQQQQRRQPCRQHRPWQQCMLQPVDAAATAAAANTCTSEVAQGTPVRHCLPALQRAGAAAEAQLVAKIEGLLKGDFKARWAANIQVDGAGHAHANSCRGGKAAGAAEACLPLPRLWPAEIQGPPSVFGPASPVPHCITASPVHYQLCCVSPALFLPLILLHRRRARHCRPAAVPPTPLPVAPAISRPSAAYLASCYHLRVL